MHEHFEHNVQTYEISKITRAKEEKGRRSVTTFKST